MEKVVPWAFGTAIANAFSRIKRLAHFVRRGENVEFRRIKLLTGKHPFPGEL